jgi:hypothetical protein
MGPRAWLLGLAVAACTFTHGGTREQMPSDAAGAVGADGSTTIGGGSDASGVTCPTRVCVDATHSGSCDGTGHVTTDRACPPGSRCNGGYCQPPGGATACTSDSACNGNDVCDLYVQGGVLVGFCTAPVGADGIYHGCDNDEDCQTGVCADSGQCFSACSGACPAGPDTVACTPLDVTIEGVMSSGVSTCVGHD